MPSGRTLLSAVLLLAVAALFAATQAFADEDDEDRSRPHADEPIVIGHRGASGYRPEHTLAAYQLAVDMGADYIEPDLVSTKDGVLVARHENEISQTTDVESHPEFAPLETTKTIDGVSVTGWFTEDFTLEQLKTLRAEERLPDLRPDNVVFNGLYEVPTLQEVIDLAKGNGVGIYPETKHPTYFDSIGLSLEEPLVETLEANGWSTKRAPVYIQSFEVGNLKDLDELTEVRLVQLLDGVGAPYDFVAGGNPTTYADMTTPAGLQAIASYAEGVGPFKGWIVPRNAANELLAPTAFVRHAHRAGLDVHPWTFRSENNFLPQDFRQGDPATPDYLGATGNAPEEHYLFYELGVDGLFSDNPDTAVAVRSAWADKEDRDD
jgi:glycerophosphoryl diester phosphodiesterase